MNEKLKEFIRKTKQEIIQSEKYKISEPLQFQIGKNFSLHDLNQLKILILTWNLAGSVIIFIIFVSLLNLNFRLHLKTILWRFSEKTINFF